MKTIFSPLLFLVSLSVVNAQNFDSLPDINGDLNEWYSSVAQNTKSPVLQGTYHFVSEGEYVSAVETPFYKDTWDQFGTVSYEGRIYMDMNMIYNLSDDLVLLWSYEMNKNQMRSLLINQAKIDSFTIHNETFLKAEHAKVGEKGFYRKVMAGKNLACFAKETKTGELEETNYKYEHETEYLIRFNNQTYKYRRIKSLYKILPEYKKQIKRFMRQNLIVVRKDERQFIEVLNYCDSLIQ